MPKNRFYLDTELKENQIATLTGQELHHLAHVMRAKPGQTVELVNGKGAVAFAEIIELKKDHARLRIQSAQLEPLSKQQCILGQCIPKFSRLSWIIEKGTELGVTKFILIQSEKCAEKPLSKSKLEKLKNIAISALKQSGRLHLPSIELLSSLLEWSPPPLPLYFGHLEETNSSLLKVSVDKRGFIFVTGPESGFSKQEISYLRSKGGLGVKLHNNTLRTDTASIVALSLLSFQY